MYPLCCLLVLVSAQADLTAFNAGMENRAGLAFSPDGQTAWWTEWDGTWGEPAASARTIFMARRDADGWSAPVEAPFNSTFDDDDPFVTYDGQWVYFVSTRPGPKGAGGGEDIWRYHVEDGSVEFVPVNSSGSEYSPVLTEAGDLYFASDRPGSKGQGDIFHAALDSGEFLPPVSLGDAINRSTGEWSVWISADGKDLVFEASSRATNQSEAGDLYYSLRMGTQWLPALPLTDVNTQGSDLLLRPVPNTNSAVITRGTPGEHARFEIIDWATVRTAARRSLQAELLKEK